MPTRSKVAYADDSDNESTNEEEQPPLLDGFRADSSEFKTKMELMADGGELYDFLAKKVTMSAYIWGRTHTFNRALATMYKLDLLPEGMSRKFGKYRKKEKKALRQLFVDLTKNPANRDKFMAVKQSCVLGDISTSRLAPINWPKDSAEDVDHIQHALSAAKAMAGAAVGSSSGSKLARKRGRDGLGKGTPGSILEAAATLEDDIVHAALISGTDEPGMKIQKQTILAERAQQEKLKNWQIQTATLQSAIGSDAFKTLPANVKQQIQDAWVAALLERPSVSESS